MPLEYKIEYIISRVYLKKNKIKKQALKSKIHVSGRCWHDIYNALLVNVFIRAYKELIVLIFS